MKKTLAFLLIVLLLFNFVACSSPKGGENDNDVSHSEKETMNQVVNPVTEITLEKAAEELKVKKLEFTNGYKCVKSSKIEGESKIYSFDVEKDGKEYNVRLQFAGCVVGDTDISGIYLDGKVENAVYDSADACAPSVNASKNNEYAVAHGWWNRYNFSVSTSAVQLDEIQSVCVEIMVMLIYPTNCIVPW